MKKTTILNDMLIVGLVICTFTAIGGALNGEIVATVFLLALACFFAGFMANRKRAHKAKKIVNLSRNADIKHAA